MTTFILTHKERQYSPVAILISFMGRKYKKAIGETVRVSQWNSKSKRVKIKAGDQQSSLVNDSLDAWQKASDKALERFKAKAIIPEADELFNEIRQIRYGRDISEETLLTSYFDTYINRYTGIRARNRIKQYKLIKNVLKRYEDENGCRLRFDDIDMHFYNSFCKWFALKKYSPNYLGDCLKVIRTVMRDAEELDKLHTNRTPFSKMFSVPSAKVDNIYLTEQELIRMYELDITDSLVASFFQELPPHKVASKSEAMRKSRDIFILGAFTGLRFSDYSKLTMENINDGFFEIYNQKTDYKTIIPIHWVIRDMIDKGFDFSTKVYEQKLNKHIKEVAMMAGLDDDITLTRLQGNERVPVTKKKYEWITSHTARRSFATNAYLAGIPSISIMKITGHKRESTFLDYIKITEKENAEMLQQMSFFSGNSWQKSGVPNGVPNGVPDCEIK